MSRKYEVVAIDAIHCTSSCHYSAYVIIKDTKTGKRDAREVDISDFRLMHKNKPFTYNGYPAYVLAEIAKWYKKSWDKGNISVCETDQYGNERRENLRYHDEHILQFLINQNHKRYTD